MLGRLVHYAADAVLLSALAAGVKRSTGLTPDLSRIHDETTRGLASKYFGIGEVVFDTTESLARASGWFQRDLSTTSAWAAAKKATEGVAK